MLSNLSHASTTSPTNVLSTTAYAARAVYPAACMRGTSGRPSRIFRLLARRTLLRVPGAIERLGGSLRARRVALLSQVPIDARAISAVLKPIVRTQLQVVLTSTWVESMLQRERVRRSLAAEHL
jgi:hypothetical protein